MTTLIFCTSYAETAAIWDARWGIWLKATLQSGLAFDRLLIVDDGSPVVPTWPGFEVATAGMSGLGTSRLNLHHFDDRLGRHTGGQPFPGWYRSFAYAVLLGIEQGFDRIVHIESDAFLISERAVDFFNAQDTGWVSLWCRSYRWPESTLQIINKDCFGACMDFFSRPYSDHLSSPRLPIENLLPLTSVNKTLVGDRYGELGDFVPFGADFVSQICWGQPPAYYWWLDGGRLVSTGDAINQRLSRRYERPNRDRLEHEGVLYIDFISFINNQMCPQGYLEVGTEHGRSVSQLACDAICIDPRFRIDHDVTGTRDRMFLFQMTSDRFFAEHDPRMYLKSLDLAMLDGLHHFEALLRDLINFERYSHAGSMALLHDCLPLNVRMTSRIHQSGPDAESEKTRGFWTGDVWRILPILEEFRPDLDVVVLDCPPTGLVICSGLDSTSTVLADAYDEIIERYSKLDLRDYGIERLWAVKPVLDSRKIVADPAEFCQGFRFR